MQASLLSTNSVFLELRFWLLVFVSMVLPFLLYVFLAWRRSIRERTVLVMGIALVVISTIDVALLQILSELAKHTPSLADDLLFNSEIGVALYAIPILFGGLGVNIVSHLLIQHLTLAERRYRLAHETHGEALRRPDDDTRSPDFYDRGPFIGSRDPRD